MKGNKYNWNKVLGASLFTAYFFYYIRTASEWHFIDNANLIFHEAGHIIFFLFGQFVYILGGSLTQILIPLIFSAYFYIRRDLFSASLLLFWAGQNIINVSIYAGDAIVMQLPLLGGDNVIHDWNYLFTQMGLLNYVGPIANTMYFVGILVIAIAAVGSFAFSRKNSGFSY